MPKKILMIDNFDSFTYNLVDVFRKYAYQVDVFRNDTDLKYMMPKISDYQAVVLSPGPGHPKDAGVMMEFLRLAKGKLPIIGICLGHQAIVEFYGGKVGRADQIVHGKGCSLEHQGHELFTGVPNLAKVARYHSLVALEMPESLKTIGIGDGFVMALAHERDRVYGLQFHPESILTTYGDQILFNFLQIAKRHSLQN